TINQIFVRYRLQNRILTADLLLREYKKTLSFAEIDLKFINSFKNWCRISEGNPSIQFKKIRLLQGLYEHRKARRDNMA
ncbi:MAG: phage integrase SAM-like domain-containing protein, partial [Bacteroidia bacterium]|nr:phage integrase SAM-like domain-containing protein [Bacteroidia bacterium]